MENGKTFGGKNYIYKLWAQADLMIIVNFTFKYLNQIIN